LSQVSTNSMPLDNLDQSVQSGASLSDIPSPTYRGLTATAWLKIALVSVALIATFRFNLLRLWLKTNPYSGEPNWHHAICVPLIGLYFLYLHREELIKAQDIGRTDEKTTSDATACAWAFCVNGFFLVFCGIAFQPSHFLVILGSAMAWSGAVAGLPRGGLGRPTWLLSSLAAALTLGFDLQPRMRAFLLWVYAPSLLVGGLLIFAYGIYPGQNDFVKDVGMIITLAGVVALLCGWSVMRIAWFPICFLICAIPWPELAYSKVAGPLQKLAASVAVGMLRLTGVDATNTGTKINILGARNELRVLNVAEACAGLRSLMTFVSVAAAVAFLSARPLWQKAIVTLAAIPIAILCNVMRVSGQGLLDHYWSQELSEGFAHQFVGIVMLIPGFFLILLVCWLLDRIFIEDDDDMVERRTVPLVRSTVAPASWAIPAWTQARVDAPRSPLPASGKAPPRSSSVQRKPEGQ